MKQYKKSLEFMLRCSQVREQLFGKEHPQLIIALMSLSKIYDGFGKIREAVDTTERMLRICEKHLPKRHPHMLSGLSMLEAMYRKMGQLEKAQAAALRAAQLRQSSPHKKAP